jgi:hypothetical protein
MFVSCGDHICNLSKRVLSKLAQCPCVATDKYNINYLDHNHRKIAHVLHREDIVKILSWYEKEKEKIMCDFTSSQLTSFFLYMPGHVEPVF